MQTIVQRGRQTGVRLTRDPSSLARPVPLREGSVRVEPFFDE